MKHHKHIHKLLSFLTILCCLAGCIAPVHASGSGTSAPQVTFVNEPRNSPDLYVTKTVENALEGAAYEAPVHAAYRFVLKLDGQIAKGVTYRLFDLERGEIIRKSGALGLTDSFRTDDTGIFTLEAGQQACFEGIGTGTRYEVTEQDTYLCPAVDADGKEETVPGGYRLYYKEGNQLIHEQFRYETRSLALDGYQKKSPAGGSTGEHSVPANGSRETFVNRYIGRGEGGTTTLEITKSVSFPQGYTPPDETPDFPFVVELGGKPYANEPFTAEKDKTGETEDGITDAQGRFNLQGGWTARFENVPVNVDYKVYEDTETSAWPQGWWSAQDTAGQTGSTQSPLTALNFHNSNVSFVVTKRLEDYSRPEGTEFYFRLSDEDNNALGGVTFYRYQTTGEPMYKQGAGGSGQQLIEVNGKRIETGRTSRIDGSFTLSPGQSAIFVGLEPGSQYRVTEVKDPAYTQILPVTDELYTVASKGQISTIDFVNRPEPQKGTLSVTKNVIYQNSEGSLNEDEFHFILYRKLMTEAEVRAVLGIGEGEVISEDRIQRGLTEGKIVLTDAASGADAYSCSINGTAYGVGIPAEKMNFEVSQGLETYSYATGPDSRREWAAGEFALKAEQTAVFRDKIHVGEEYLVLETDLTEEYSLPDPGSSQIYTSWPVSSVTETPSYAKEGAIGTDGLAVTFANNYSPRKIDLQITKTDETGAAITDHPADFMLYRTRGKDSPVLPEGVSGAEGFAYSTDSSGVVTIPGLKAGTYWLYELKAPSGYCLLPEPVEINVAWTPDGLSLILDGVAYEPAPDEGAADTDPMPYIRPAGSTASDILGPVTVTKGSRNQSILRGLSIAGTNAKVSLQIRNNELYELPNSGGIGIYWYSIGGTLLMLAAALILYKINGRGGVRRSS